MDKMDNRGKRWSEEEEEQMVHLFENGATPEAVASRHGRSAKAVMLRLGSMLDKGHGVRLRNVSDSVLTKAREMFASEASSAAASATAYAPTKGGADQHALMKILAVLEEIREEVHKMRAHLKKHENKKKS